MKIGADPDASSTASSKQIDVFTEGEPDTRQTPSVLGRRSYIDDILIPATSWADLYEIVDRFLRTCDKWNLSIGLTKRFWGRRKVDYLGHQVSLAGLEAHPKDLGPLVNIPFPRTLRSMQSFLGSLNYYSRFIEDFSIYASALYELSEADFYEVLCMDTMKSLRSNKRIGDRKYQDNSDPDRIDVTGGDRTVDYRKGHGDSDIDRIGVTEGDSTADERKGHVDTIQIVSVLQRAIQTFPVLQGAT